jgi:hypothetical protein
MRQIWTWSGYEPFISHETPYHHGDMPTVYMLAEDVANGLLYSRFRPTILEGVGAGAMMGRLYDQCRTERNTNRHYCYYERACCS